MKKIVAIILTLILFALCGCNAKPQDNNLDISSTQSTEFTKPENYITVLQISINPKFNLYLDINNIVLAVEPVNADAQGIMEKITVQTGKLDTVIDNIITKTNDSGFIKENEQIEINFEITEIKESTVKTNSILNAAKDSATTSFDEINITTVVKTAISENAVKYEEENDTDVETSSNATILSSDPASSKVPNSSKLASSVNVFSSAPTSSKAPESSSTSVPSTKPTTSVAASSSAPISSKAPESSSAPTSSSKPAATVTYTPVLQKGGSWVAGIVEGTYYYDVKLTLTNDIKSTIVGVGEKLSSMPLDIQEYMKPESEIRDGEYYYFGHGDHGEITSVSEKGTTIVLVADRGGKITFTRIDENKIKLSSASANSLCYEEIPIGSILTFTTES